MEFHGQYMSSFRRAHCKECKRTAEVLMILFSAVSEHLFSNFKFRKKVSKIKKNFSESSLSAVIVAVNCGLKFSFAFKWINAKYKIESGFECGVTVSLFDFGYWTFSIFHCILSCHFTNISRFPEFCVSF